MVDFFDTPQFTEQAEREMREWGVDPIEYCNITGQNIHEILEDVDYDNVFDNEYDETEHIEILDELLDDY